MPEDSPTICPHCRSPLLPSSLVCATCHRLVFEARVGQLLQEVSKAEAINPTYAAGLLRQAMMLIPPGSQPYQMLAGRAAALAAGSFGGAGSPGGERPVLQYGQPPPSQGEPLTSDAFTKALLMTGGSMALSIWIYQREWGWHFAIGFVVLILIHEMGHVFANMYYGLKQSPPIFIPYMGAVIWLKSNPPDAKAEAVVGIAGPVAGTLGALACYAASMFVGNPQHMLELRLLAHFAFVMNLFNMIPCPPLDGGRVTAAITPLLWIPGIAAFIGAMFFIGGRKIDFVTVFLAVWILQSALPRVRNALMQGGRKNPYYQLTASQRVLVTASYVLLAGLLAVMFWGPTRFGLPF
jgi:Zn-dependent protease